MRFDRALRVAVCMALVVPAAALAGDPTGQGWSPGGSSHVDLGTDTAGHYQPLLFDSNRNLMMNCAVGCGGSGGARPDTLAAGTLPLTVGQRYTVALGGGQGVVAFRVTGLSASGGAVLAPQFSNDGGSTWGALSAITAVVASTVTADGNFRVDAAGHTQVSLLVTTAGTGSASIASNASAAGGVVVFASPQPVTDPATAAIAGSVRANDAGTSRDQTHDDTVARSYAQQTYSPAVVVTIVANTSTTLWTTNSTARSLSITPGTATGCYGDPSGATASTTASRPLPASGWVWDVSMPPPNTNVTGLCTGAGTIIVQQGN